MKITRTIFVTTILTLMAFGAVVYTSCRKDRCKRVVCQNGGTCNDGFCFCPSGYTGTYCQIANVSSIAFKNTTFTPVTIIIKGIEYTVDTGKTITFTGSNGERLRPTARTKGLYGMNVTIPMPDGKDSTLLYFPARYTNFIELKIPKEYFFLTVTNNNPTEPEVSMVYVNTQLAADSTLDVVTLPTPIKNTGKPFHIGYYRAYVDSKVRLEKTPRVWNYSNLFGPVATAVLKENQYYNAVLP